MTALQTVVPLPLPRKVPQTGAERAKAYRARKKAASAESALRTVRTVPDSPSVPVTPVTRTTHMSSAYLCAFDASTVLAGTAFAAALVGVTMNGWYGRSLGSTDVAGWLFLAIGVVADVSALTLPTCLARVRQRLPAVLGWAVWAATFVFAICAGIGFASTNISDVTASRASRVTPAIVTAQTALADASAARDRECKGGVGKYCREREAAVAAQRAVLEAAQGKVEQQADPQVQAATKMIAWISAGYVRPTADDFAMLRLVLLALLPQVGGILLMVARGAR